VPHSDLESFEINTLTNQNMHSDSEMKRPYSSHVESRLLQIIDTKLWKLAGVCCQLLEEIEWLRIAPLIEIQSSEDGRCRAAYGGLYKQQWSFQGQRRLHVFNNFTPVMQVLPV
jgi:hypothetical protein